MTLKNCLALGFTTTLPGTPLGGGARTGEGGIGGSGKPMGGLRMSLTDAPSCGYDAVNITVESVRVHQSASADDRDPAGTRSPWRRRSASTC
jgi:hypothetical protein